MKEMYRICSETMAMVPEYDENGRLGAAIIEENQTLFVPKAPSKIVKENASYYNSSYEGLMVTAKMILKDNRMLPVPVSTHLDYYFIPMQSPNNPTCIWLSHKHVTEVDKHQEKKAKVILHNDRHIIIELQRNRVMTKIQRTDHLKNVLQTRNGNKMSIGRLKDIKIEILTN